MNQIAVSPQRKPVIILGVILFHVCMILLLLHAAGHQIPWHLPAQVIFKDLEQQAKQYTAMAPTQELPKQITPPTPVAQEKIPEPQGWAQTIRGTPMVGPAAAKEESNPEAERRDTQALKNAKESDQSQEQAQLQDETSNAASVQSQESQPEQIKTVGKTTGFLPQATQKESTQVMPVLKPQRKSPFQASAGLSKIAKSFFEKNEKGTGHLVNMIGDPNRRPTAEQLKHERYGAKIMSAIHSALKIHKNEYLTSRDPINHPTIPLALIRMALDRNGKLLDIMVAQSSGLKNFDNFLLFICKYASSSFPPVPIYLTDDPYVLGIWF